MRNHPIAACAALMWAALPASAGMPDFDQGPSASAVLTQAREAVEEPLWVSIAAADLGRFRALSLPLGAPVRASARAAIFRVMEEGLPELSRLMHERTGRCGGFFAHRDREQAERDLQAPPAPAGGPYSLDQQAVAAPIAARVEEASIRSTIQSLATFHNRYYQAETGTAAANWIERRWRELARGLPGATVRIVRHSGWKQPSVVLTIPGADLAGETVVLGGHLDSISGFGGRERARAPGADDNASGIATLTEAIRVLSEAGWRPRRTVEFMGYAAEEVGLRGSADIARQYAAAGRKVAGVIQFDMTNFAGSPEALFFLSDHVDPGLSAFLGRLADEYLKVKRGTTRCGYACSDHASWSREGFAASAAFESAFETMNRALHTENDTLETMGGDAEHTVPFAKLAAVFAVELAKTAPTLLFTSTGWPPSASSRKAAFTARVAGDHGAVEAE